MRTKREWGDGMVAYKQGNTSWVHQFNYRQNTQRDRNSSITILNFEEVKMMGHFSNIVTDNTGIPTIHYHLDTDGTWSMTVKTLEQLTQLLGE